MVTAQPTSKIMTIKERCMSTNDVGAVEDDDDGEETVRERCARERKEKPRSRVNPTEKNVANARTSHF